MSRPTSVSTLAGMPRPARVLIRPAAVMSLGVLLLLAGLGGCTHYVPTLAPSMSCDLPASLTTRCDGPEAITGEITYGELIQIAQRDRQRLQLCGVKQQDLLKAVDTCRSAIAAHNAELDKINLANKDGAAR